jgi:type II/III secretion system protein
MSIRIKNVRHPSTSRTLAMVGLFTGALMGQQLPPSHPPIPVPAGQQPAPQASPPPLPLQSYRPPDMVVQIFKLKYARPEPSMQKALELLAGGGKIAFDGRTNSLVVQTTADKIPQIKEYLSDADQPEPSRETMQIRLVWLMAGLPDAGKAPPKDLDKVLAELAKFEFGDLQMVAQSLIHTTQDGTFHMTSNPMLGTGQACSLRLEGTLQNPQPQVNQVQVQLSVGTQGRGPLRMPVPGAPPGLSAPQGPPEAQIATDISTSISAPSGHPVVLCACPTEKAVSVFIIQVIPAGT